MSLYLERLFMIKYRYLSFQQTNLLDLIMVLVGSIIFPIQSCMSLRSYSSQLTMVQAAMSTDLDLTPDVHA